VKRENRNRYPEKMKITCGGRKAKCGRCTAIFVRKLWGEAKDRVAKLKLVPRACYTAQLEQLD
jgi:hypothetical protein